MNLTAKVTGAETNLQNCGRRTSCSLADRMADQWAANLARTAGTVVVTVGLFGGVLQAWLK